jgi:hypothetical protein
MFLQIAQLLGEKRCTSRRGDVAEIRKQSVSRSQKYSYEKVKPVAAVYEINVPHLFIHYNLSSCINLDVIIIDDMTRETGAAHSTRPTNYELPFVILQLIMFF